MKVWLLAWLAVAFMFWSAPGRSSAGYSVELSASFCVVDEEGNGMIGGWETLQIPLKHIQIASPGGAAQDSAINPVDRTHQAG